MGFCGTEFTHPSTLLGCNKHFVAGLDFEGVVPGVDYKLFGLPGNSCLTQPDRGFVYDVSVIKPTPRLLARTLSLPFAGNFAGIGLGGPGSVRSPYGEQLETLAAHYAPTKLMLYLRVDSLSRSLRDLPNSCSRTFQMCCRVNSPRRKKGPKPSTPDLLPCGASSIETSAAIPTAKTVRRIRRFKREPCVQGNQI